MCYSVCWLCFTFLLVTALNVSRFENNILQSTTKEVKLHYS